jgi:hypothetical protein
MPKTTIIADMKYKRRGEHSNLRELLKYLQYRDGSVRRDAYLSADPEAEFRYPEGVSDYVKPTHRDTRWVDRGMGETYSQIGKQAEQWQGRSVLARTWVISPDPEIMRHVPEGKRFELVQRVTEGTIERWYSDNGWGQAEYSYVVHDKHRSSDGEQMAHAHVITPGTVPIDAAGELGRIDHIVKRPHLRDLNRTAGEVLEEEMGRILGKERAQQVIAERNARLEREQTTSRQQSRKLKDFADVVQLIRNEQQARDARKAKRKQKRSLRRRMAELRIYANYISQDRRKRWEEDRQRAAIARQQQHEADLQQERDRHQQRVERKAQSWDDFSTALDAESRRFEELVDYYSGLNDEPQPTKQKERER